MRNSDLGFDLKELDREVRPQDDFFKFVNGKWIAEHPIPPAEFHWGIFSLLRRKTELELKRIVEKTRVPIIRNLYRSGIDMKRRNALGMKPLVPFLKRIEAIKDRHGLITTLAELHRIGINVLWNPGVAQDLKQGGRYILYLEQGGLGMPDRDYYLKDGAEEKRVREAYRKHIVALFQLMGVSRAQAERNRKTVMRIETTLARSSTDRVTLRDPEKNYYRKTLAGLMKLAPAVYWKKYLRLLGTKKTRVLIVSQPKFIAAAGRLVEILPLSDWKTYLCFHLADDSAGILSRAFVDENFAFYGKTLTGSKKLRPLWRRVLGAVNGSVGEAVGKIYVKRYFSQRTKRRVNALVSELFRAYEARIKKLGWMSAGTKRKALAKLRAVSRKLGYPSRWKSYRGLMIRPDDYFGNTIRSVLWEHRRGMRRIGKPVERHEWHMRPQTVNAYYLSTANEIVFPAAILQPPLFDPNVDDAVNYGAIGATIGHEMTHGFDDQGSKFDAKGNLKRWWNTKDRKRFERRGRVLVRQFGRYEIFPGAYVNGKLTLGENIADLGGVSIAFDAYQRRLKRIGRRVIGGFTPEQRFFIGWARAEREHARPEYLKTIIAIDTHSPPMFRVNGPASNLSEFYNAFNVKKGDKLYRNPSERAKIW